MTKKQIIIIGLIIFISFGVWYLLQVRECVVNRAEGGIVSDWATLKDCSY